MSTHMQQVFLSYYKVQTTLTVVAKQLVHNHNCVKFQLLPLIQMLMQ